MRRRTLLQGILGALVAPQVAALAPPAAPAGAVLRVIRRAPGLNRQAFESNYTAGYFRDMDVVGIRIPNAPVRDSRDYLRVTRG
jgi:hypothetical protein